ncbi:DUF6174 domain-containing protein [Marinagarivorans cellulosilyticus]|uniref:Uncharacterized protein n=1 Tax=Marinagarivorans cellulosilyticus TaxID=2721545 RepID=A0AAN2BIS4_9GAMM|nr:DUF6174 domain-containing protein [Marinagarivorans cellulosilyticus]BCD96285.1 hypothetical protein MARGE09_P0485 [Marinagarivorans cellulosilyticus]
MNARITALLATACLLSACDGSDIKVTIETRSSSSEVQSSAQSSSSVMSSVVASSSSSPSHQDALEELAYHRAAWQRYSAGHYQYEFYIDCFCFGRDDFLVEWRDGDMVGRSPIGDEAIPVIDNINPRIPALFDTIESAIRAGNLTEVSYNPQYGYPERVVIDPLPGAADDESSYRITHFVVVQSSSSSSSEPPTLSDTEKAERLAERDKASVTWSNHQYRSYQYQLGDYGNCIVGFNNCNGVYDYTFTTFGVVDSGEATLGFGKSISDDFGYIFKGGRTLDSRANLSDSFVTIPTYSISYSKEGIGSWSYSYPDRSDDDYGRDELLSIEFFDELEATRQTQAANWLASKPDGEYSYTLTVDCDCYYDGSHRIVVTDNGVSAAPLSATHRMPDNLMTIDALFELLENAYSEPSDYIDVTYNQDRHFPETITFNPTLPRSTSNATYTINALTDRYTLNYASKALAQWRMASDSYFEYRFESKEFSINLYHYLISALGRTHQIQSILNDSETPPIAANIEQVYQTIFEYSDARDIEFQANTHGVPTEVRIHPADRVPGDYLQYLISNFQWLTSTDSSTVDDMQRMWESGAINNYIMTVNVSCFCIVEGPVEVEVRDGTIVRAYAERLERELTEQERSWRIYTIKGLFDEIKATLTQERTAEVLFNREHYYPQLVVIDREGQAVDAGFNLEITNFKALD